MNNFNGKDVLYPFLTHKNVRIIKLVLIMLTVMLFRVSATESYAQSTRINLSMENSTVKDVLKGIESILFIIMTRLLTRTSESL